MLLLSGVASVFVSVLSVCKSLFFLIDGICLRFILEQVDEPIIKIIQIIIFMKFFIKIVKEKERKQNVK